MYASFSFCTIDVAFILCGFLFFLTCTALSCMHGLVLYAVSCYRSLQTCSRTGLIIFRSSITLYLSPPFVVIRVPWRFSSVLRIRAAVATTTRLSLPSQGGSRGETTKRCSSLDAVKEARFECLGSRDVLTETGG